MKVLLNLGKNAKIDASETHTLSMVVHRDEWSDEAWAMLKQSPSRPYFLISRAAGCKMYGDAHGNRRARPAVWSRPTFLLAFAEHNQNRQGIC